MTSTDQQDAASAIARVSGAFDEGMALYATEFPEIAHEHFKPVLKTLLTSNIAAVSAVADLYAKKAALQKTYASQLESLCTSARKQQSDLAAKGFSSNSPAAVAWAKLVDVTELEASELLELARASTDEVVAPLQKTVQLKQEAMNLVLSDRSKLEERMRKLQQEVDKAHEANEEASKNLLAAQHPDDRRVSIAETVGLKKKPGSAETSETVKRNTHNQLMLTLAAVNAEWRTYYEEDLTVILQRLQDGYAGATAAMMQTITKASKLSETALSIITREQVSLGQTAELVDVAKEAKLVVKALRTTPFVPPTALTFRAPPISEHDMIWQLPGLVKEGSEVLLAQSMKEITDDVMSVASKIGQESNAMYGIEKLHAQYQNNPSFGHPDTVLPRLYAARNAVRDLKTQMNRHHAQLYLLQGCNVDDGDAVAGHILKPYTYKKITTCAYCRKFLVGLAKQGVRCKRCLENYHRTCAQFQPKCSKASEPLPKRKPAPTTQDQQGSDNNNNSEDLYDELEDDVSDEDWSDEDVDDDDDDESRADVAVVMFDYQAMKDDELTLEAGGIVTLKSHPEGEEWWLGLQGGRKGIFPASYVRYCDGDPFSKVRTLYEYKAGKDDELSFPADELITLVEPREGWSLGRYKDKEGLFPASYVDESFVHVVSHGLPIDGPKDSTAAKKASFLGGLF